MALEPVALPQRKLLAAHKNSIPTINGQGKQGKKKNRKISADSRQKLLALPTLPTEFLEFRKMCKTMMPPKPFAAPVCTQAL